MEWNSKIKKKEGRTLSISIGIRIVVVKPNVSGMTSVLFLGNMQLSNWQSKEFGKKNNYIILNNNENTQTSKNLKYVMMNRLKK